MTDVLTYVATPAWVYVALWVLLTTDAFIPVVPTQAIMITAGALTVYGGLDLSAAIAAGTVGVLTGDATCYLLGRLRRVRRAAAPHLPGRPSRPSRPARPARLARRIARRAATRLAGGLRHPGPVVIMLCRFVPGGRMAACYSAGRAGYPVRRFGPYATLAALGWATYGALVGHLGGAAVTQSVWQLAAVAVVAAAGFAAAGWGLALAGRRPVAGAGAGHPAGVVTPARAASTGVPPRSPSPTTTGRSLSCGPGDRRSGCSRPPERST